MGIQTALALHDFHIFFLIPVVVAATRYGLSAALASALASTAASAFFFHPPIYSLKIISPSDVMALAVFIVVALITSQLAAAARENAAIAARNFRQLELLYGFSRQLTGASGPEEIVQAIRQHVSGLVGSPVTIITDGPDDTAAARAAEPDWLPDKIRKAIGDFRSQPPGRASILVSDADTQKSWLLRALTRSTRPAGVLIVELEPATPDELENLRLEVDRLLDEAVGTLDRLDLATTVADAEARRKSEALRDAIIGSASHSMRTPLASILGAASVLSASPPVANDPRLAPLAQMIVSEAERLNSDIQKMLDAAALSSSQLKPQLGWMAWSSTTPLDTRRRARKSVSGCGVTMDTSPSPSKTKASDWTPRSGPACSTNSTGETEFARRRGERDSGFGSPAHS
jgi:two-component system sensor histidine kinase KdpD